MTTLHLRTLIRRSRLRFDFLLIPLVFACFVLSPVAQAQLPPPAPDGGYPNDNTAEGQFALFSVTTGGANTAIGSGALLNNTTGNFNTANGGGALVSNTTGNFNTANGHVALGANTTGSENTANGDEALSSNTTGNFNAAYGAHSLENTTGSGNIALGFEAGFNLSTGSNNIDIGNLGGAAAEANTIRIGNANHTNTRQSTTLHATRDRYPGHPSLFALKQVAPSVVNTRGGICFWF
jgi:hypothetical protein